MDHDDAAVGENEPGRDAEMIGEDRELIGAPVAVRIFTNLNSIVAMAWRLHFIWVIKCLSYPKPAAFIPSHANGFSDLWFGGKKAHSEARLGDEMLHGFIRGER